jgi:hypothetical protein
MISKKEKSQADDMALDRYARNVCGRRLFLFPWRWWVVLQEFGDRFIEILLLLVGLSLGVEGFAYGSSPDEIFTGGVVHIEVELADVDG